MTTTTGFPDDDSERAREIARAYVNLINPRLQASINRTTIQLTQQWSTAVARAMQPTIRQVNEQWARALAPSFEGIAQAQNRLVAQLSNPTFEKSLRVLLREAEAREAARAAEATEESADAPFETVEEEAAAAGVTLPASNDLQISPVWFSGWFIALYGFVKDVASDSPEQIADRTIIIVVILLLVALGQDVRRNGL